MMINVAATVHEAGLFDKKNAAAIAIDVLRATSVITTALANGAAAFYPTEEIEEAFSLAKELAARHPQDKVLLGGERLALKIPGFDLANSPLEYTVGAVSGARLVMTTSNGTRAIKAAGGSQSVYIGCLRNAAAVARQVSGCGEILIVCAGTQDLPDISDSLAAGAIIRELETLGLRPELGDLAMMCRDYFNPGTFEAIIRKSRHGRRLSGMGLDDDILYCCKLNAAATVPKYDGKQIVLCA